MRILIMATVLFLTTVASGQVTDNANTEAKVKGELQKLFADLNQAITKKDRAALERLYADEFIFIRSAGAVNNKAAHINGIMANDPISSTPVPTQSFDQLFLHGDVAISRNPGRSASVTSIFIKRDGRWQMFQAQGTRLAPERNPVKLDSQALDTFLGRYEFGPGAIAIITRDGDALKWRGGNRMPGTMVPLSDTHFFLKESEAELMFTKNGNGQVTDVVLRIGVCQDSKAKKIE